MYYLTAVKVSHSYTGDERLTLDLLVKEGVEKEAGGVREGGNSWGKL